MPARFDDIEIGQVASLGAARIEPEALAAFIVAFAPGWSADRGAPDAMVYALWSRLDATIAADWPQTKRLGVDALRWMRNPPAGELLRGRMPIMGKDGDSTFRVSVSAGSGSTRGGGSWQPTSA